jgi:hypothetical protein
MQKMEDLLRTRLYTLADRDELKRHQNQWTAKIIENYYHYLEEPLWQYAPQPNPTNKTYLMEIAMNNYLLLLKYKNPSILDIIETDDEGNTALHLILNDLLYRSTSDHLSGRGIDYFEMVKYLISHGANIYQSNKEDVTSYDILEQIVKIDPRYQQFISNDTYYYDPGELPTDIFELVLQTLSYQDLLRLCGTSRLVNQRFCNDPNGYIWKFLYRRDISELGPIDQDNDNGNDDDNVGDDDGDDDDDNDDDNDDNDNDDDSDSDNDDDNDDDDGDGDDNDNDNDDSDDIYVDSLKERYLNIMHIYEGIVNEISKRPEQISEMHIFIYKLIQSRADKLLLNLTDSLLIYSDEPEWFKSLMKDLIVNQLNDFFIHFFILYSERHPDLIRKYINNLLFQAINDNNIILAVFLVEQGADDYDTASTSAVIGNHSALLQLFINLYQEQKGLKTNDPQFISYVNDMIGYVNFTSILNLLYAIINGHLDVNKILIRGIDKLNPSIIKWAINHGANNIKAGIDYLYRGRLYRSIYEYNIRNNHHMFDKTMLSIIKIFVKNNDTESNRIFNNYLSNSIDNNGYQTLKYLLEYLSSHNILNVDRLINDLKLMIHMFPNEYTTNNRIIQLSLKYLPITYDQLIA